MSELTVQERVALAQWVIQTFKSDSSACKIALEYIMRQLGAVKAGE